MRQPATGVLLARQRRADEVRPSCDHLKLRFTGVTLKGRANAVGASSRASGHGSRGRGRLNLAAPARKAPAEGSRRAARHKHLLSSREDDDVRRGDGDDDGARRGRASPASAAHKQREPPTEYDHRSLVHDDIVGQICFPHIRAGLGQASARDLSPIRPVLWKTDLTPCAIVSPFRRDEDGEFSTSPDDLGRPAGRGCDDGAARADADRTPARHTDPGATRVRRRSLDQPQGRMGTQRRRRLLPRQLQATRRVLAQAREAVQPDSRRRDRQDGGEPPATDGGHHVARELREARAIQVDLLAALARADADRPAAVGRRCAGARERRQGGHLD